MLSKCYSVADYKSEISYAQLQHHVAHYIANVFAAIIVC
jgi:hypothetical protein